MLEIDEKVYLSPSPQVLLDVAPSQKGIYNVRRVGVDYDEKCNSCPFASLSTFERPGPWSSLQN